MFRKRALVFVALLLVGGAAQAATSQAVAAVDFRAEVVALTNVERAKVGCAALTRHEALDKSAQGHGDDMAAKNYFSHTGLDGSSPFDRMRLAGYPSNSGRAENIAAGYDNAVAVVQGWMNSEGHRKNMLNCAYRSIGVGYAYSANAQWRHYWVQNFGTV